MMQDRSTLSMSVNDDQTAYLVGLAESGVSSRGPRGHRRTAPDRLRLRIVHISDSAHLNRRYHTLKCVSMTHAQINGLETPRRERRTLEDK